MYNPRSEEPDWEWVEIINNTGATIDFSATPYILDDLAGAALETANITSGLVANGAVAILYNGDALTHEDMQGAWDPGAANGTNFIPVTDMPQLNNSGGDTFGLWDNLVEYQTDFSEGTTAQAVVELAYGDTGPWPVDDGNASIYLGDLGSNPNDGFNWFLSVDFDGLSFDASEVYPSGEVVLHPGGDVGSPGYFDVFPLPNPGDFNADGTVNNADLGLWVAGFGTLNNATFGQGDADGDGDGDGTDFLIWQQNFGFTSTAHEIVAAAVPEPAAFVAAFLIGIGIATRRQPGQSVHSKPTPPAWP